MPGYDKSLPYWARRPAFGANQKYAPIPKLSRWTARLLNREYLLGVFCLAVGACGQMGIFWSLFPPHSTIPLICGYFFLAPIALIWFPIFCNQPLLPFQSYVIWCLRVQLWVAGITILFEVLHALGALPVRSERAFEVSRMLMLIGWLSFIPQIHYHFLKWKYPAA